jgi:hypothetical protein
MDETVRSSTSSSSYQRRHALLYLGCFICATLGAGVAVHILWKSTPLREHVVLETIAPSPPSPAHYLSVTDSDAVDAHVFLHELEDVCSRVRAADVLFFGDSRLQLAFRTEALRTFFSDRGLRYYMLGFPHGTDVMARRILERCDPHPRLAVVFETAFFTGFPNTFERVALEASAFEARKLRLEFELAFAVRRRLHRLLPHPVGRDLAGGSWILYRSRLDGSWWVAAELERDLPVEDGGDAALEWVPDAHLRAAAQFRAEIERRGGELALAYVPSRFQGRNRAHSIARYLGVPLLDPPVRGLTTADGFHLRADSAERYARAFLGQLEALLPQPLERGT